MTTKTVTVENRYGIHVRPSTIILKEMGKYPQVTFELNKGDGFVVVSDILTMMSLELTRGTVVEVRTSSANEDDEARLVEEDEACLRIVELLETKYTFDEE